MQTTDQGAQATDTVLRSAAELPGVRWAAVNRPKHGQTASGDAFVVEGFTPHGLQVALIDGLGGGEEAAFAAGLAARVIHAAPAYDPAELLRRCHGALQGTRGAVMALLTLDIAQQSVGYVGVGNIGLHALSAAPIKPISKNGIVGYRLPTLLKQTYRYNSGDTFVLYSDGISSRLFLDSTLSSSRDPLRLAESILERHGQPDDDASVVVVQTFA